MIGRRSSIIIAAAFLTLLAAGALSQRAPVWLLAIYLCVSLFTFAIYAFDKSAARAGRHRIRERTLHMLSLAGGWPGALVAQQGLRHKSRKQPFRAIFWSTVLINCAAVVWLLFPATVTTIISM